MEGAQLAFRAATPGDADAIVHTVELAFESYRAFAPDDWKPPLSEHEGMREHLRDPAVWCQIAESDGAAAGHVALMPAAMHAGWPEPDPGLAHLWQLFVREPFWGSGLAVTLHSAVIEEARARGFARFRLFTPAAQGRARRFYEREGWALSAPPFFDERFGMDIAEYRRAIS